MRNEQVNNSKTPNNADSSLLSECVCMCGHAPFSGLRAVGLYSIPCSWISLNRYSVVELCHISIKKCIIFEVIYMYCPGYGLPQDGSNWPKSAMPVLIRSIVPVCCLAGVSPASLPHWLGIDLRSNLAPKKKYIYIYCKATVTQEFKEEWGNKDTKGMLYLPSLAFLCSSLSFCSDFSNLDLCSYTTGKKKLNLSWTS